MFARRSFLLGLAAIPIVGLENKSLGQEMPASPSSSPDSGTAPKSIPAGDVRLTITRATPFKTVPELENDPGVTLVTDEVQTIYKNSNAPKSITPEDVATTLDETHDEVITLNADYEYYKVKNTQTCEVIIVCIWEQSLIINDQGQIDPILIRWEVYSEV